MRIAFVGDLMLVGSLAGRIQKGWNPFVKAQALLQDADLRVGNLESVVSNLGKPTPFKSAAAIKAKNHFVFRAPLEAFSSLKSAGFHLLTMANNHAMDYGWEAANQTLYGLHRRGIQSNGVGKTIAQARKPAVLSANNQTVAFLSYLAFRSWEGTRACGPASENAPGIAYIPPPDGAGISPKAQAWLKSDLRAARKMAQRVIVCYHWGIEREPKPHDYQRALARFTIEQGADAVIGHHPHVLQPMEYYRNKPIAFSLGNFVAARSGGALGETVVYYLELPERGSPTFSVAPVRIVNGEPRPKSS